MKTFSPKIDAISENIIYLLSLDSRQTVSSLAQKLGVNRKIVENRFKKLFSKGFVNYLTVSNEKNRTRFTMLLKLKEMNEETIGKLKKFGNLIKLKETLGAYDISILFDAYSLDEFNKTISQVTNLLHNSLITYDILPHDFEDTLGYKSFCHNPELFKQYLPLQSVKIELTLDEQQVLSLIKKQTNLPIKEIAKQTKKGYAKVKEILNKLEQNQIVRYTLDPNYNKLKLEFHNMFIKINLGQKEQFEKFLTNHPRIHWIKRCSGKWDYCLSITAQNMNEFVEITKEIRTQNKNTILDDTTLVSHIKEMRRI